jgi:hypothetical protein
MNISATIDNLTIDSGDTLSQNNNISLSLDQNVFNSGTITMNSAGSITGFIFNSGGSARTATLSGGGTITMSNITPRIVSPMQVLAVLPLIRIIPFRVQARFF